MGGPDFEVVALSIDRAGSKVIRQFFAEIDIKHLSLYIDFSGKAAGTLKAVGLPTTLLIDREGREIGRLVGSAEWDTPAMLAFLQRYVSKKASVFSPQPAINSTTPSTSTISEHDFDRSRTLDPAAPGNTTSWLSTKGATS